VKGIKEHISTDSSYLKPYENKLVHILNCILLFYFTILIIALIYFRLFMIRYNEDPCLNLNGPERKFKILLNVSAFFFVVPQMWLELC